MRRRLAAFLLLASMGSVPNAVSAESFKVIVNPRTPGRTISRETLSRIYLGHVARWGDGRAIEAVDLSTTSAVRAAFSQAVLGMSVVSVRQFWVRTLESGHFPPPSRPTDEDVIAFVAGRNGAVGYVSEAAPLPDTVKAVAVQ